MALAATGPSHRRRRGRSRCGDAVVPAVAGSVGEEPDGQHAPGTARAVDADGADRVIDPDLVKEEAAKADEHACDSADDERAASG